MYCQINYDYRSPIRMLYGNVSINSDNFSIPIFFPAKTSWGECVEFKEYPIYGSGTISIELGWISISSQRSFYYNNIIDLEESLVNSDSITLLFGLTPQGEIAIWLQHELQSVLLRLDQAVEITSELTDEMIEEAQIPLGGGNFAKTISQLCLSDIRKFEDLMPEYKSIDSFSCRRCKDFMSKYYYNYKIILNDSQKSDCDIRTFFDALYDGTHNKLNDGSLMKYHEAGIPKKLALKWHIKKSDYSAYFWFEDEEICTIFNKFYGQHPDTKTDFIIHIDPINKKYELSLYRYGLKQPVIIPESAYQLIVFKSGFENYRSDNYNQPTGAWIW